MDVAVNRIWGNEVWLRKEQNVKRRQPKLRMLFSSEENL
jgi:hypothetical protein